MCSTFSRPNSFGNRGESCEGKYLLKEAKETEEGKRQCKMWWKIRYTINCMRGGIKRGENLYGHLKSLSQLFVVW